MTKQLVFIDESGDPGFKANSSQNFAFALIIFEDSKDAEDTELTINHIATQAIHLSEFKYSKTCNRVKDIFFQEISACHFRAKILYVNKKLVNSSELRSNANKFYNFFLKQVLTHARLNNASVKLDGKKDSVKTELINYIRSQAGNNVAKIKYEDSKNNRLIQLADMIVGLTIHAHSPTPTESQKKWLNQINKKLDVWIFK